ncbi:hypothetical protein AcdelDRAFT_0889 [Acidovorax delafieldii 2AN]|uniref:Uncharacterized protein n=1 Tax=Acidovorax delafieldii 2AN TaxID=573060 RepID=C5T1V9_ACIDE|nr:hypothetical protein [Acidovorax delafieldii]EER61554.1 hypothetical protein AcdelDRAFT_0889 [Acidovorax delafieldii 2AN]
MANGRALPSALLFDWLLGRAWNMALVSYANAERLGSNGLGGSGPQESGISMGGGAPSIETFLTKYAGDEPAALVVAHDRMLEGQMKEVADKWSDEFQKIITLTAGVGPGFTAAVDWLNKVANGQDGLGYLGYNHRAAQADSFAAQVESGVNQRGLPMPPGGIAALRGVAAREAVLLVARAKAQMQADRVAEQHKLRIDAVEALIKARNEALDATMDYVFTQVHLMFDVFGRNNDYLTRLQREEQSIKARMDIRSAELAGWGERIQTTDDSRAAAIQKIKSVTARSNTIDEMTAESHIKQLRRYSSRAAAALNSAGVSVNSTAQESNTIDAGA